MINSARRQNIPAFREKGVCKIGENMSIGVLLKKTIVPIFNRIDTE
jgi:hypothetical protein